MHWEKGSTLAEKRSKAQRVMFWRLLGGGFVWGLFGFGGGLFILPVWIFFSHVWKRSVQDLFGFLAWQYAMVIALPGGAELSSEIEVKLYGLKA